MIALLEAGADIRATADEELPTGHEGLAPRGLTALEHAHCVSTLLLAGASIPAAAAEQPLIQAAVEQLGLDEPSASTAAELAETLRAELTCPITHENMERPVVAAEGSTYERSAIESERCSAASAACMRPRVAALLAHAVPCLPPVPAAWIARQQAEGAVPSSPATNLPLEHLNLAENRALKAVIASLQAAGLLG